MQGVVVEFSGVSLVSPFCGRKENFDTQTFPFVFGEFILDIFCGAGRLFKQWGWLGSATIGLGFVPISVRVVRSTTIKPAAATMVANTRFNMFEPVAMSAVVGFNVRLGLAAAGIRVSVDGSVSGTAVVRDQRRLQRHGRVQGLARASVLAILRMGRIGGISSGAAVIIDERRRQRQVRVKVGADLRPVNHVG